MVKMIPMVCPKCGATIDVQEGTKTCYCTYCGTKILIDDSSTKTINQNINIHKTTVDETEVKKAEVKKAEAEASAKTMKYSMLLLAFLFTLLFLMWIFG